ncbi:hypothetical protein NC652_013729 [Populus alba x Populus x berolinensis]|uniref:Uncharacterized protein n=1 Tax=Populus alba x Populus x berolinensis TaxID=444605 RepID=A0AAD6W2U2_9ROSI|nr:hypothetical protein NC652_013729 [Populus alba x Populus x berolinensis]KAJ6997170.1 hypothetical protein NC653_013674 [Populus alba x Populus x berolinensis]
MLIRERRYVEKERKSVSVKLSFKSQSYRLLEHHLRGDNQRLPEARIYLSWDGLLGVSPLKPLFS